MKTYRSTHILLGLFFASLVGFWGLEYAGVRTEKERRLRETRVLPALLAVPEASIVQVAIDRGAEHFVFKRRGPTVGRWQMVEPTDAAAEPTRLETLVRNLKDLRTSIDSGKITGPAADYGLAPPAATIRVWANKSEDGKSADQPIATLAVGKTVRNVRYVQADAADEIEAAESKLLTAIDLPAPIGGNRS